MSTRKKRYRRTLFTGAKGARAPAKAGLRDALTAILGRRSGRPTTLPFRDRSLLYPSLGSDAENDTDSMESPDDLG